LILTKIIKIVAIRRHILRFLAEIRGLLLRGWEGGKGKGGERIEEGKGGKGRKKCSVPPPTFD